MEKKIENIKPIFLLADSQLLFLEEEGEFFIERIKEVISSGTSKDEISAAYIGASNDDDPRFYDIFRTAMEQINIKNCRMIKSYPTKADNAFLEQADIILLAGGDVQKGLGIIEYNGWDKTIIEKYAHGAVLIGVSAGAIQLGTKGYTYDFNTEKNNKEFNTLGLVPFIIDVHSEDDWLMLSGSVQKGGNLTKGYGIPYGAGIIYYPDMTIEAVRYPGVEIVMYAQKIEKSLILPYKKLKETHKI